MADNADTKPDAAQLLYQDQLGYSAREEKKAKDETIARVQKQLATVISDPRTGNDGKLEYLRNRTLANFQVYLRSLLDDSEMAESYLSRLDKYGWGNVPPEKEELMRKATAELLAFAKQFNKKFSKVINP